MKRLNSNRTSLVVIGVVAAITLGSGRSKAEIIMSGPTNVGQPINDSRDVQECDFSADGLELYIGGGGSIRVATRETTGSDWGEPVNILTGVEPAISPDGLELYFRLWGQWDLLVARRPSKGEPWSPPVDVGATINSYDAWEPDISADGLSLYFCSDRPGGYGDGDIWVATRTTTDDEWGEPVNLGPNVNRGGGDNGPSISNDNLTLVFGRGVSRLWATTRKSIDDDWGPAVELGINGPGYFYGPALSPDGSTIYFDASASWGGYGGDDLWQISFTPNHDLSGDGIVDAADMCIMVDNWHTNSTLCDIAPLPLGDNFVDIKDLIVLAENLFEEPRLIAYWMLDETEGDIAYDSAGGNFGTLSGNPIWQPDSGQVVGALQFDGLDDYISTDFILDPSTGVFSVFAWIQGGGPGQVIISQRTGAGNIWLGLDAQSGTLMTGLVPPSSGWVAKKPLVSETIISDGQWHHVGFVWDGSYRILYADGIEVAKDAEAQNPLKPATGGLCIGADKTLAADSFFSGFIDDVRIYNQALNAEEIAALAQ